jgi:2-methylisocitrate lyase-like PEP mutase family enzyme
MATQQQKAADLLALHTPGTPVVLANVWDVPSAKIVAEAGYPAIATSSAGAAWAMGYADGLDIGADEMIQWCGRIARAVDQPVTFDLENGYGDAPEDVAACVTGLVAVGGVGCNIEDSDGLTGYTVYDRELAVARIAAGAAAAEAAGVAVVLNARTDVFFPTNKHIEDPLAEAIARGNAYLEAGAGCIFVPFTMDLDVIAKLVSGINGPVNALAGPGGPTVPEMAAAGVARVSIGGGFSRVAYGMVKRGAEELRDHGTLGFLDGGMAHPDLNKLIRG